MLYFKKQLYKLAQRLQLTLGTSSQQCPDKHLPAFRRAFGIFIATAATPATLIAGARLLSAGR